MLELLTDSTVRWGGANSNPRRQLNPGDTNTGPITLDFSQFAQRGAQNWNYTENKNQQLLFLSFIQVQIFFISNQEAPQQYRTKKAACIIWNHIHHQGDRHDDTILRSCLHLPQFSGLLNNSPGGGGGKTMVPKTLQHTKRRV